MRTSLFVKAKFKDSGNNVSFCLDKIGDVLPTLIKISDDEYMQEDGSRLTDVRFYVEPQRGISLDRVIKEHKKDEGFLKEWCTPDMYELPILRKIKGFTQEELAEAIGTQQESISRLENNADCTTLKRVGEIAYALGYRAEIVFTELEEED